MKLAQSLGMTETQLRHSMGLQELANWRAMHSIEPIFIQDRMDAQTAMICYTIARSNGADKVELEDFFPRWEKQAEAKKEKEPLAPESLNKFLSTSITMAGMKLPILEAEDG